MLGQDHLSVRQRPSAVVLAQRAPEDECERYAVQGAAYREDAIGKAFREEDVRHGAAQRSLSLGKNRQGARPARHYQNNALDEEQDHCDPGPRCDAVGDAAIESVDRAQAEDPEDDRVDKLDPENRDSQLSLL